MTFFKIFVVNNYPNQHDNRIFLVAKGMTAQQRHSQTGKHSSKMHTDRALTRMSSDRVAMRPIVNRMTDRRL